MQPSQFILEAYENVSIERRDDEMIESACSQNRRPLARTICVMLLVCIGAAMVASAACGQEPLRVRRNFFGCHNLMDGGPAYQTGIDWTQEMNGPGFVFDWVRGDFELWMAYCFQRNLIPCMRLQNGNGGELPSPGYMGNVVSILCNYKLAHPEYADRLVYLQLWNEPGDARDYVDPATFSQSMIDAWNTIQTVVANAAAQNPAIAGTFKIMTPGQNGPAGGSRLGQPILKRSSALTYGLLTLTLNPIRPGSIIMLVQSS